MSLSRSQVRTAVRTILNEPTAIFFTDANINEWISEGSRDISLKTFCLQAVTSFVTINGTSNYVYPTTIGTTAVDTIGVKTLINSNDLSLQYVSLDLLGRVGAGTNVEQKWSDWARRLYITPTPTAVYTMEVLIWYTIGESSDVLNLPSPYHHLLILYGAYRGFMKRRDYVAGATLLQQYNSEVDRIISTITRKFGVYEVTGIKQNIKDQSSAD